MVDQNMIGLVSVVMGLLLVMIPVAGFTLRFAVKPILSPLVSAIRELREGQAASGATERRLLLMEDELDDMRKGIRTLLEAQSFDKQLVDPNLSARAQPTPAEE